jgi:hypothetical protein
MSLSEGDKVVIFERAHESLFSIPICFQRGQVIKRLRKDDVCVFYKIQVTHMFVSRGTEKQQWLPYNKACDAGEHPVDDDGYVTVPETHLAPEADMENGLRQRIEQWRKKHPDWYQAYKKTWGEPGGGAVSANNNKGELIK